MYWRVRRRFEPKPFFERRVSAKTTSLVGQRVEILGQLQTEGERTILIVRSIADIRKLRPESKGK